MQVIDGQLVIKHFINEHGVVLRIVGHGNGDVVVMAAGHGSVARWDAGADHGVVSDGHPITWLEWTERVMELASQIRES